MNFSALVQLKGFLVIDFGNGKDSAGGAALGGGALSLGCLGRGFSTSALCNSVCRFKCGRGWGGGKFGGGSTVDVVGVIGGALIGGA